MGQAFTGTTFEKLFDDKSIPQLVEVPNDLNDLATLARAIATFALGLV